MTRAPNTGLANRRLQPLGHISDAQSPRESGGTSQIPPRADRAETANKAGSRVTDSGTGGARDLIWFSSGAASAVAAMLTFREKPDAMMVRCETNNEDEDNHRFEADVVRWLNRPVTLIHSDKFASVWDVWVKERFMAGVHGASCTRAMKLRPRLDFQRPGDVHYFGYTADAQDVKRFERLKETFFELQVRAPLIDYGITKAASLAIIEQAGIVLPRTYAMGFPNANCLKSGCVKSQSPAYWALFRHHFPERFKRTAVLARELGVRLVKIKGKRAFIDEIPAGQPFTKPIVPACDFLCAALPAPAHARGRA